MSFRKIRPSFGAESSPSNSNPSQSTSESTGSDPSRQVHPSTSVAGGGQEGSSSSASKRRRVPDSVTRNACLNCKKARAKCDGKTPCTRCTTRVEPSPCKYEIHIKHAKEELVKQIKELRAKDHSTQTILDSLSTNDKVPEILQRLKKGDSYSSIAEWLGRAPMEDNDTMSPRESLQSTFEPSDQEMGGVGGPFRWTTVTNDSAVFDHLFQLYFAWVHPVHTIFSEGHFVESYKRPSHHFCSSTLVNAICALACHLHSSSDADEVDFDQLSSKFSDTVRSNLNPTDRSITTAQAFAVMFLVDCARGKCLRATSYLKVANEILSCIDSTEDERFPEVLRQTVRGIRSLNVEWAQFTFQIPNLPSPYHIESRDDSEKNLDDAQWYYYRDPRDQCPAWPGLLATTNREKAKLIEIMNEAVMIHYSPSVLQIQARQVLQIYSKLMDWRENLPKIIGNIEDNNSQPLPHVLSLLFVALCYKKEMSNMCSILHSTAVTQLLRPLLDFKGFPSEQVEQVIWNHAQQGLFLLNEHYRKQYTTRYQPVLQMFSMLHLCDIIARFFPNIPTRDGSERKDGVMAIKVGLEVLMISREGFEIAGPFQELLKQTAIDCGVRAPRNAEELMAPPRPSQVYTIDDFIDSCTRPTYLQPVSEIQLKYSPTFASDWSFEAPKYKFQENSGRGLGHRSEEERGAQSLMQIRNLLNLN